MADLARTTDRAPLARLLDLLADAFAERVAAAFERHLRERQAEADPAWGMVSQKTLPPWIHPEAYTDACRDGLIPGARLWRRQWRAPKDAVLAWVAAESREVAANAIDPESPEGIIAANGIEVRR